MRNRLCSYWLKREHLQAERINEGAKEEYPLWHPPNWASGFGASVNSNRQIETFLSVFRKSRYSLRHIAIGNIEPIDEVVDIGVRAHVVVAGPKRLGDIARELRQAGYG